MPFDKNNPYKKLKNPDELTKKEKTTTQKQQTFILKSDDSYIFNDDDYHKIINNLTEEQNRSRVNKNKHYEEYFRKQIKYFTNIHTTLSEINQNKDKLVTLKNKPQSSEQKELFLFLYDKNKKLNKSIVENINKISNLHNEYAKKYEDFDYPGPYLNSNNMLVFPAMYEN